MCLAHGPSMVAQICNLLYRRFATGLQPANAAPRPARGKRGRSADYKSAIQQSATLRYDTKQIRTVPVRSGCEEVRAPMFPSRIDPQAAASRDGSRSVGGSVWRLLPKPDWSADSRICLAW
jgi:hypothetical protein